MRRLRLLLLIPLLWLPMSSAGADVSYARGVWNVSNVSFYGPGLYGNGMACGGRLTTDTIGVAHRWLQCGHLVEFEWQGHHIVTSVIDRGPYIRGREWDLTSGLCEELTGRSGVPRCNTGTIAWRL